MAVDEGLVRQLEEDIKRIQNRLAIGIALSRSEGRIARLSLLEKQDSLIFAKRGTPKEYIVPIGRPFREIVRSMDDLPF